MSMALQQRLGALRRRVAAVVLAGGFSWALAAGVVLLIGCMWLDLAVELPPALRVTSLLLALVFGAALVIRAASGALRGVGALALARRLDLAGGTAGQILAGVDLWRSSEGSAFARSSGLGQTPLKPQPRTPNPLTAGMTEMAVGRAGELAAKIEPRRAAPVKPLARPVGALCALGLGIGLIALAAPRLASTQWLRFFDPYGDHPPYSRVTFEIEPGDAAVVYGSGLDLRVRPQGGRVERVEAVLQIEGGGEEPLPMFPESGGAWRTTIAQVTTPLRYHVRAPGSRSARHRISVITVPRLESVRFRITPPEYTHLPPYEGPLPQGGIAGLAGTRVEVWARSNRPLSGGSLIVVGSGFGVQGSAADPLNPEPRTLMPSMATSASKPHEAFGEFTITSPGSLSLTVTDVAGQDSTQAFNAPIALLHDDRPFVRLMEPKPISFATPDVAIEIVALAEDDYGVSRVQLFRGLNESRVRAEELAVPSPAPRRLAARSQLNLADYGLNPGDIVKLFARVEDTDPAGAKGSESSIALIRIISRQEMERMLLAREGMEVLQSKYEQARRRLEAIQAEIEKLQKELEKLDPESELAKAQREAMEELAKMMQKEADAIAEAAEQDLPFDIDAAFRDELKNLGMDVREAAEQTRELARRGGLGNAKAHQEMEKIGKFLAGEQEEFEEQVLDPLEHLAKVFPLKEDEARFVELYQRQRELEQRMKALSGQDGKDDPKLKARMRDLEAEQDQISQDLRRLLDDIEAHLAQLPEAAELDELRETARAFAEAVRQSEAGAKMTDAQTALAEFAGTRAQLSAREAADILESFLSKCQGMGEQASGGMTFQPGLADALGGTVEQLLAAMGLGTGGMGMGGGGLGGYSARRSTLGNVGLYGHLPTRSQGGGGNMRDRPGPASASHGDNDPDNAAMLDATEEERAAGEAAAAVPVQYKRRVGAYFQRVADELGEERK